MAMVATVIIGMVEVVIIIVIIVIILTIKREIKLKRKRNPSKSTENVCYRCVMKGRWSRSCITLENIAKLYQAFIKKKFHTNSTSKHIHILDELTYRVIIWKTWLILIPTNVTTQTRLNWLNLNLASYMSHRSDSLLTPNLASNTPHIYNIQCAKL